MRIVRLNDETRRDIMTNLLKRSPAQYTEYENTVKEILDNVRTNGDEALFELTHKFDKFSLNAGNIRVTEEEINEAYNGYDRDLIGVMERAAANIRSFHEKQKLNSWIDTGEDGSILGQKITPIEKVGVYVPGGKAAYPSSTLMNIIPAAVAGVDRIIMTTPPGADGKVYPGTLVAAKIAGVKEIYKVVQHTEQETEVPMSLLRTH